MARSARRAFGWGKPFLWLLLRSSEVATAVSGPVQPPTLRRLCGLCREAEPESETQGKPATRPGVFEEPWDASWLWFLISDGQ